MQLIGKIKFVQIQQESLKEHKDDGTRNYNPTPLLQLNTIKVNQAGVVGLTGAGSEIIDVHNTKHPNSRYRGDNPVSIGFTSHYGKMRQEFGNPLTDGIAGENIIVECDTIYTPSNISQRLAIKSTSTDTLIYLNEVIPIPPCEPFSRFVQNRDLTPPEIKATLQFLSNGIRGFYMTLEEQPDTITITTGDMVYLIAK